MYAYARMVAAGALKKLNVHFPRLHDIILATKHSTASEAFGLQTLLGAVCQSAVGYYSPRTLVAAMKHHNVRIQLKAM